MNLCDKVMANCFVNASYNPAKRNGTCTGLVGEFYVGFQWENGASTKSHHAATLGEQSIGVAMLDDDVEQRNDSVIYPFPRYSQDGKFRDDVTFAVNTALNFII